MWDAGLGSFESLCKDYKVHLERDSACPICSAKVYQTDRRAKSCPILAQVALAAAWTRAGVPEELAAADFSSGDVKAEDVWLILEGGHDEEKLLRLARHCGLCDAPFINQQDWRRHMHLAQWNPHKDRLEEELQHLTPGQPCPFCQVDFTKTPKAHLKKCLLQAAFLRAHGGAGGGLWKAADTQAARRWGREAAMDHTILAAAAPAKFQRAKEKRRAGKRGSDDGSEIGLGVHTAVLRNLAEVQPIGKLNATILTNRTNNSVTQALLWAHGSWTGFLAGAFGDLRRLLQSLRNARAPVLSA